MGLNPLLNAHKIRITASCSLPIELLKGVLLIFLILSKNSHQAFVTTPSSSATLIQGGSMAILKINYDDLQKLEYLPQKIKQNVIRNSLVTSILNTRTAVSEFAFKKLEQSKIIKFDRKVQKKRITLSKISDGTKFENVHAYLRFSTINESLSSFPWKKTTTIGTNGRMYPGFIANVLGRSIVPMPKTFISNKKKWSLKRLTPNSLPLRKAKIDHSSISDLLRFDNHILNNIITRTNRKYEYEDTVLIGARYDE